MSTQVPGVMTPKCIIQRLNQLKRSPGDGIARIMKIANPDITMAVTQTLPYHVAKMPGHNSSFCYPELAECPKAHPRNADTIKLDKCFRGCAGKRT